MSLFKTDIQSMIKVMRFRAFWVDWDTLFFRKLSWARSAKRARPKLVAVKNNSYRFRTIRVVGVDFCPILDSLVSCVQQFMADVLHFEDGTEPKKNTNISRRHTVSSVRVHLVHLRHIYIEKIHCEVENGIRWFLSLLVEWLQFKVQCHKKELSSCNLVLFFFNFVFIS